MCERRIHLPGSFPPVLAESGSTMAAHDLTMRMIPYYDRQLVYPLLHFLTLREVL